MNSNDLRALGKNMSQMIAILERSRKIMHAILLIVI